MKVIEHSQDRLTLQSSTALLGSLLICAMAVLIGFCFFLFGLALQQSTHAGIIWLGVGSAIMVGIPFFAIEISKISTFTFDKSRDCILWEQHNLLKRAAKQSVEFPLHLIAGVEVVTDAMDSQRTSYYFPRLLLASVYWRIPLHSDGRYKSAVTLAKTIAQFLNIDYFPDEWKAPKPMLHQKILDNAEPGQFGWKYLENKAARLEHHIKQYPQDAEAHQNLGMALYRTNRLNRKRAIGYLQQAEELFEIQQQKDCAAIARVLQALVGWGY